MTGPVTAGQDDPVRFGVLGPLQVIDATGITWQVPAAKQRVMLATLLLGGGSTIAAARMSEALWDVSPPGNAPVVMRTYVMRLRRALGPAGARVVTRLPGWAIVLHGPEECDLTEVEHLWRTARVAAESGDWARTSALLVQALSYWRGDPLTDVPSVVLARRDAARLGELRLQLTEARIDADLHLGRHAELVMELRRLAGEHPLREHLRALLMLACYRSGQQAAALEEYRDAHRALVRELGVAPGPELQQMHQRILAADPGLAIPSPREAALLHAGPGQPPDRHVPRQLPPAPPSFTGRAAELRMLGRLLDKAAGTVVITAVGGTAGVSKTALAVHWAHRAAATRFSDGQLYVNLRGYDPGQSMPATDALAGFLRSLGVPGPDIPPEPDERAARYRSLLTGKRMVVILDNAGSAEQVRPLLPGTPSCAVLVTSRDALAGLVARDGATRLDLDVLPPQDAVALLRTLIGARVDAEPSAAAELAAHCCRLPLALRVAAELVTSRPVTPLSALAGELTDLRTRLDLLTAGGDPHTDVRAVFSWSYRHLDAGAARTFRLLGLHPSPDLGSYAAAGLTGTTLPQARQELEVLARVHLIQPSAPGRYRMHDLLRAYACELTATLDTPEEQHAALTRLFDHYLYTAATAMDILSPAEIHRRPRIAQPTTPVPPLPDTAAAREWLDRERATLVAATAYAAAHGWPGYASRLADTLAYYLHVGGHTPEALSIFSGALSAACRSGDLGAQATALSQIGDISFQQGRFEQASDHYRQALTLFRAVGDRAGEARVLSYTGNAELTLGCPEQATRHQQEAVTIFHDLGDRFGEARALGNLGRALQLQGRNGEAVGFHQLSLALFRDLGDQLGEAWALSRLGTVDLFRRSYQRAAEYLQQAVALFQQIGATIGEAEILASLADAYLGLGRFEQAGQNLEQALAMSRAIGAADLEALALNGLGGLLLQTGDAAKAHMYHAAALRLASQASAPRQQARAHLGLARAYQASGDTLQARHHWQEALTHYAAIGAPEAGEIRAQLASIGDGDDKPAKV